MKIVLPHTTRLVQLFMVAGGVGLASSCRPDAAPSSTAAKPTQSVEAATKTTTSKSPAASLTPDSTDARLVASRQLVARLNALPPRAWSKVQRVELYESTEGGEALFYFLHGEPQKIVARYLGETGQQRIVFYLQGGQHALVLEQTYQYNRPITYDSASMRENADNEVFDFDKSTIQTTRSYFDHGRLLYQVTSPANDSAAFLLGEQRRLANQLHSLLAQAVAKK